MRRANVGVKFSKTSTRIVRCNSTSKQITSKHSFLVGVPSYPPFSPLSPLLDPPPNVEWFLQTHSYALPFPLSAPPSFNTTNLPFFRAHEEQYLPHFRFSPSCSCSRVVPYALQSTSCLVTSSCPQSNVSTTGPHMVPKHRVSEQPVKRADSKRTRWSIFACKAFEKL
jgi:hypothetical protein